MTNLLDSVAHDARRNCASMAVRCRALLMLGLFALPSLFGCQSDAPPVEGLPASELPHFTPDGMLVKPKNWETWVMVGASLGLTYTESGTADALGGGPGMFHNVFMQPWAYERFVETGEFAEETMFILAFYEASRDADPARGGFYEGELSSTMEVHLKKRDLHETGWGFFGFFGTADSAAIMPGDAACYSCHIEKTKVDNVFVQFYPPLRRVLSEADGN